MISYGTKLGRFLQTDPIGTKDDPNLYAYVGNDPLDEADPTGNTGECTGQVYKSPCPPPPAPGNGDQPEQLPPIVVTARKSSPIIAAATLAGVATSDIGIGEVILAGVAIYAVTHLSDVTISAEETHPLPTDLTGDNPRDSSGKRVNTDLPGGSQEVFDKLSGGKSTTQPDGTKVAPNGVRLRPGTGGEGPRIDVPGSRPPETIHFPTGG